jgi:hypothetical protein
MIAPIIEAWLAADEQVHRKQRHTARRISQRLRDEHGFAGRRANGPTSAHASPLIRIIRPPLSLLAGSSGQGPGISRQARKSPTS